MKYKCNTLTIKKAILEMNINCKEMALKAQISRSTLFKALKGEPLTVGTCNKIADALGKPVTELFTVE